MDIIDFDCLRDELAKKESSPYHETSAAREIAFKNGWDAAMENTGKLVKRWGEEIVKRTKLEEELEIERKECKRLSEVATHWQNEYYKLSPRELPGKIDNNPIA